MSYIADLHIHSPHSRATSPRSDLLGLAGWASLKGIALVGTGDCTHPGWLERLRENLQNAEAGLFRLKKGVKSRVGSVEGSSTRFILSGEISSIYKKDGKTRKIHNLVFFPDFASLEAFNARLRQLGGNLHSDGRPILGLDAKNLLEILLETAPDAFLVPAHIWTPWFSLFGAKSGFDRLEDCFEDLSPHIFALETGLSSDPAMIRTLSALDSYSLISNSDCHSPEKLGREANLFSCPLDFFSLREALKNPVKGFEGTLEFYPDEGKYHLAGHRKCKVALSPCEAEEVGGLCPLCHKPLTQGVLGRVRELADRTEPVYAQGESYESLIPLGEILAELFGVGVGSKRVQALYFYLTRRFGSEFNILRDLDPQELHEASFLLVEALTRLRQGRVIRQGGYDGEYGRILLFQPGELEKEAGARKELSLLAK